MGQLRLDLRSRVARRLSLPPCWFAPARSTAGSRRRAVRHQQSASSSLHVARRARAAAVDRRQHAARAAAESRRAGVADRPNERPRRAPRRARHSPHADGRSQGRRVRFHARRPSLGGPEEPLADTEAMQINGVVGALDVLDEQLADRNRQLTVLEDLLLNRKLRDEVRPRGGPSPRATSRRSSAVARIRSRAGARSTRASTSRAARAPRSSRSRPVS